LSAAAILSPVHGEHKAIESIELGFMAKRCDKHANKMLEKPPWPVLGTVADVFLKDGVWIHAVDEGDMSVKQ